MLMLKMSHLFILHTNSLFVYKPLKGEKTTNIKHTYILLCDNHYKFSLDRVPNELWIEARDIVQETGIKTIPKKNKCKKAKCLSEEGLQIAVKSKGEKERYKHLNAEFQRIARRGKKAFLSDHYK